MGVAVPLSSCNVLGRALLPPAYQGGGIKGIDFGARVCIRIPTFLLTSYMTLGWLLNVSAWFPRL